MAKCDGDGSCLLIRPISQDLFSFIADITVSGRSYFQNRKFISVLGNQQPHLSIDIKERNPLREET